MRMESAATRNGSPSELLGVMTPLLCRDIPSKNSAELHPETVLFPTEARSSGLNTSLVLWAIT